MTHGEQVWAKLVEECNECERLVLDYFHGDDEKMKLWFCTPNPGLGNIAPKEMVLLGRSTKLLKFIRNLLEENKR